MLALSILILASSPKTLDYKDGVFRVDSSGKSIEIPIEPANDRPDDSLCYRCEDIWVVWDQRGLTVRRNDTAKSFKLEEISVTPKLFQREQILETVSLIKEKRRSKSPKDLSGYEQIGDSLYILPRWEDSDGKPWLEAVVKIDLTKEFPKPELVGRLPELTCGHKGDRLFAMGDQLATVAQKGTEWGIEAFSVESGKSEFKPFGENLDAYSLGAGGKSIMFIEKTNYGSNLAGAVWVPNGRRRNLAESKGEVSFFMDRPIVVKIKDGRGTTLLEADSAETVRLPNDAGIRKTDEGVLIWAPNKDPKRASLFDPAGWTPLAEWKRKTDAAEGKTLVAKSNGKR